MNISTINPAVKDSGTAEAVMPPPAHSTVETGGNLQKNREIQKSRDEQAAGSLSVEDTKELVEAMNGAMDDLQTSLGFSIREELNHQVVVEIKDRKTDELIKQIPAEELLTIKEKMEEFTGLIFDQSV